MRQTRRIVVLTLLAVVLSGAPILAQDVLTGQTPGGAFYTIAVPPVWNGSVVIYNHGFSLTPGGPGPDLGPLQDVMLAEGYAIAASSYRQIGWAVFASNQDLEELMAVFRQDVGEPNQIIIFGISLGGIVTAAAIEQANLGGPVAGALTLCGAVGGSRNWAAGLDFRLTYDAICQNVPGANIPGAENGLALGSTLTPGDIVTSSNICFGHDLPAEARSKAQQARLDKFLAVTGIPQNFINTDLASFATFGLADLNYSPDKLAGGTGFGNKNVDYGDPMINATIKRVPARRATRKLLRDNYTPSGDVGNTKIVSIHTDKDGLVIVENESEYASVVPPQNLTIGVVVEAVPTHCGATSAELLAAWETLRGWLAGDPQPTALTLAIMCGALEPYFDGPCRYNPFFQIPDMDGRARPRRPANSVRAEPVSSSQAASTPGETAPSAPAEAAPSLPERAPAPRVQSAPSSPPRANQLPSDLEVSSAAESRLQKFDRRER